MGLKVGLVARCLNTAHIRGMGRYVHELLRQSQTRGEIRWSVFGDDPRHPLTVPPGVAMDVDVFEFKGDRFHLWEQVGLPRRALRHGVDLLHCTEATLPWWQPKPTIVSLHDTLMWGEPRTGAADAFYVDRLLPAAFDKCAAIITISESSRDDILKKWPQHESKLSAIYMGIADEYFTDEALELAPHLAAWIGASPYIVYLGGALERKRFDWALEVIGRCTDKSLKLVACGFAGDGRTRAMESLAPELQGRVHFANFLSDPELRALYRGSAAVLYPTLYEGFGFPAVEAQAAGVPAIFSALGSLRELIGPLAMVVPPHDIDAWLAALAEARSMGEARAEKARAARAWARKFSWTENFDKHLAIYRKVANARTG